MKYSDLLAPHIHTVMKIHAEHFLWTLIEKTNLHLSSQLLSCLDKTCLPLPLPLLTSLFTPAFLPLNYSSYCFVLSAGSPSLTLCLFYSNYHATGYTVTEPINVCSWINCLTAVVHTHTPTQTHRHPHTLTQSVSLDQSQLRLPGLTVSVGAHACQSEYAEYLCGPTCVTLCLHICVCARGYAGWSCGPVRQGQMVPGGWLSSWWPSWWCCLWSLLIRYASLPESPAPSCCLFLCLSHCSQFMSVCLPLTLLCICNTHSLTPSVYLLSPCPSFQCTLKHTQHTHLCVWTFPKLSSPQNTGRKELTSCHFPHPQI